MEKQELNAEIVERPRPTILAAEALTLLAVLGLWVASLIVARLMPEDGAGQAFLLDALYYLPFVLLPVVIYCARRPGLSDAMRLNPMPVLATLTVVFAGVLSVYLASALDGLWAALLNAVGLREPEIAVEVSTRQALTLAILHTAAIPAICEELLCRGFVLSAFESRGTRLAVWVSAILFALMHGNVFGLPAYLMVGVISAFLVFALDSLYAGMIYHTVYNTVILVTLYLLPETEDTAVVSGDLIASVAIDAAIIALSLGLLLKSLDLRRRLRGIEAVPRVHAPLRQSERLMLIALATVFLGTGILVLAGV